MSNELQRLADEMYGILELGKHEPLTSSQCAAIDSAINVLTALAMVSESEPNRLITNTFPLTAAGGSADIPVTTINPEYADHWRNKAMQLALDVEAWKALAENCQESQRGYKEENERLRRLARFHLDAQITEALSVLELKQQLAEAQANASRWQFIRQCLMDEKEFDEVFKGAPLEKPENNEALDAIVDASIAQKQGQSPSKSAGNES